MAPMRMALIRMALLRKLNFFLLIGQEEMLGGGIGLVTLSVTFRKSQSC